MVNGGGLLKRCQISFWAATIIPPLGIYLLTVGHTVTGEDSGELIAAAYSLGVPHPPGYPLWTMLAKLAILVVPCGEVAWRVHLLSASCATAAGALAGWAVWHETDDAPAGVATAWLLCWGLEQWTQSVIAEVYALNTLFIVAVLMLFVLWWRRRTTSSLVALTFLAALGTTNHYTLLPVLWPLAVIVVFTEHYRLFLAPRIFFLAAALAVGWLPWLYLLIASRGDPPIDWGNPETGALWWAHVSREQYNFLFFQQDRSPWDYARHAWLITTRLWAQWTPGPLLLGMTGLLWLRGARAKQAGLIVLLGLWLVNATVFTLNLPQERESLDGSRPFHMPLYTVCVFLVGAGLAAWRTWMRDAGWRIAHYTAAAGVVLVPLATAVSNYAAADKSGYKFAREYAETLADTLPPNTLFFASSDHSTFPLLYLQVVEGVRPDVTIADPYGYIRDDLIQPGRHAHPHWQLGHRSAKHQVEIEEWLIARTDRPVCFSQKRGPSSLPPGSRLVPWGLTYRLQRAGEAFPAQPALPLAGWPRAVRPESFDYTVDAIAGDWFFVHARDAFARHDYASARIALDLALEYGRGVKEVYNNCGSLSAENGLISDALMYYERALAMNPTYDLARHNAIGVALQIGDGALALRLAKAGLEIKPDDRQLNMAALRALEAIGDTELADEQRKWIRRRWPGTI